MINFKQEISFPEIGSVRKGAPKTEKGYVGQDLGNVFRVIFAPGKDNDESKKTFSKMFGGRPGPDGSVLVERIEFMLPFTTIERVFDSWWEGYTAGRMVARADGERFIRLVDTKTGEVIVNNGEPYKAFDPKEPVGWYTTSKGERKAVMCKPVSRLKMLIPELHRVAYLMAHSTGIYDAMRLQSQLAAVELMAATTNGGSVAGIPLVLTRSLVDVTWVQPDGTAKRVPKWLLNVEIDPRYVGYVMGRLKTAALAAGASAPRMALPSGATDEMTVPAEVAEQEGDDFAGEWDEEPGPEPEPEPQLDDVTRAAWVSRMSVETARSAKNKAGRSLGDMETRELYEGIALCEAALEKNHLTEGARSETLYLVDAMRCVIASR